MSNSRVFEAISGQWKRLTAGSNPQAGAKQFVRGVYESIGLIDKRGGRVTRADNGFPVLAKDAPRKPADFPPALILEAILGRTWQEQVFGGAGLKWLSEEAVVPIGPSAFANVAAWTAIGGLVQGATLDAYDESIADFELLGVFPTKPIRIWNGGERMTSVLGPSEPAPKVGPGESHPDAKMNSMWVETGKAEKYGLKVTVTRETAEVDIFNGQILEKARNVGYGLAYREHELTLDALVGVTNNWRVGFGEDASATSYNTYDATIPAGPGATQVVDNSIVNPLTNPFTAFQTSDAALSNYRHPVTGLPMPMRSRLKTLIVAGPLELYAQFIQGIKQATVMPQLALPFPPPPAGGLFPSASFTGDNPWGGRFNRLIASDWLYEKLRRATSTGNPNISPGLGLSSDNALRWFRIDPDRSIVRRIAWEADINTIDPASFVMRDQGIVLGQVADAAMQIQVVSPFGIQMNAVA